jgi:hypothetical protein
MTASERPTRPQLNEEALFLDENGNLRSLSGRTGAVEDPFPGGLTSVTTADITDMTAAGAAMATAADAEAQADLLAPHLPAPSIAAADITDSTVAGRAMLTAETEAAQRTLIGAEFPTILLPSGKNVIGNIPDYWAPIFSADTTLIFGNSVTTIGSGAFNSSSLTGALTIPNSVTSIGNYAFSSCTGLTSLTIGNSVTSIGNYAFKSSDLTGALTIPNSVTSIGNYAFGYCWRLTGALTIPNSVTSIGSRAFQSCSGLTSLTIGNSVTSIGSHAFNYCSGLTSVNCRITKAVFDATAGAANMFANTSASLVLHALPATGWSAGTGLTIGGNTSVDVVLDLT